MGPDGSLLLGSTLGLFVVRIHPMLFTSFLHGQHEDSSSGRASNSCRGLAVYDNYLYVNDLEDIYPFPLNNPGQAELLFTNRLKLFPMLVQDSVILTGREVSPNRIDPETREVTRLEDTLVGNRTAFWSLCVRDKYLYLGAQGHLQALEYPALLNGMRKEICVDSTSLRIIYQVAPLDGDREFVVTSAGLFVFSTDRCRLQQVSFFTKENTPLRVFNFVQIDPDPDGSWWVATLDAGLIHFTLEDSVAHIRRILDKREGIITNTTYASFADDHGYRWISTDQGLIRLRVKDWTYEHYTMDDGLIQNEFNRISYTRDAQGNMYFGGLKGVTAFNPGDFRPISDAIPLRVLDFQQYSGWQDTILDRKEELLSTHRIVMHPSDRFIRLKVGLLDFFKTGEQRYSYRIEGIHDTWQRLDGNLLTINVLPYGKYSLIVRGRTASGVLLPTPCALILSSCIRSICVGGSSW